MKRCVGIRREDEITGGSQDAYFLTVKLNYFLKSYARGVGSGEVGMDQCSIASFLSCLT